MLIPITTYVFPSEIIEIRPLSHRDDGYLVLYATYKGLAWGIIEITDLTKLIYGEAT